MKLLLIGQILGSCKCKTRSDDTLDSGVVCQIEEKDHSLHRAVLLEVGLEETGDLHIHTHSCEDDAEVLLTVICDVLSFN